VLVTGGLGFIGRAVTKRLVEVGHEVVVMSRGAGPGAWRPAGPVTSVQADVRDRVRLTRLLAYHDVEAACHLAALTSDRDSFARPLEHYDINLGGTLHLLAALDRHARATGRPTGLAFASSGAVYGDPGTAPVPEDAPTRPVSPYGASKLAAEQAIAHQAATGLLGAVTIRHFNAAGAAADVRDRDVTHLIPGALAVARGAERALRLVDETVVREFTHVTDLAESFRLAVEHTVPGRALTYNVGSGTGVTIREVLDAVEAVSGRDVPVDPDPARSGPLVQVADSTRAQHDLRWTPEHSSLHQIVSDAWHATYPE